MCDQNVSKHQKAMRSADKFALESSFQLLEHFNGNDECPERPSGWEEGKYNDRNKIELKMGWYRLTYSCSPNLSFTISVLYSFDSGSHISGKPGGPIEIQYGHFTSPEKLSLSYSNEIELTLNKIYE